ncbi:TonB-dependent receptor [Rheinheimera gaetbuli]
MFIGLVLWAMAGKPDMALAQQKNYAINIAPAPLPEALQQLASQTGYGLLARADILPDSMTTTVQGQMPLALALAQLLANSGLQGVLQGNMILLLKAPALKAATAPAAAPPKPGSEAPTIEHMIVRGYRDSLSATQLNKRSHSHIVDTLFAEDMANFPQLNLGDALQRLPGMVAERDNGETRQLGLRGLGPNFVRVQINGIESLATMNSVFDHRGSAERTRNFDFNVFDAALFNQIDVEKTYVVSQDEGGIAGTINLRTPKPFDFQQPQAKASIKAGYNDLSGRYSPRFSALLSDNTAQLGALLSVAYSENTTYETGYRDWGWRAFSASDADVSATQANLIAPTAISATFASRAQQRLGLNSVLQWRPSNRLELTLNNLYARLNSDDNEYNLANLNSRQLSAMATDQYNTLQFARFAQTDIRSEAKLSAVATEFLNNSLDLHYQPSTTAAYRLSASVSQSDFNSPLHDKIFLQAPAQPFSFDYRPGRRIPQKYYDIDLTAGQNWQLHRADVREDKVLNRFAIFAVSSEHALHAGSELQFGAQLKEFRSSGFERRDDVRELNHLQLPLHLATVAMPLQQPFAVADVNQSFASLLTQQLSGRISGQPFSRELGAAANRPGTAFTLTEHIFALYGQYNFAWHNWRGNVGLRWLNTDVNSHGESIAAEPGQANETAQIAVSHQYTNWLPALNLAVDVNDSLILRFAASRNLSRPSVSDLRATADVSIADNRVELGNPALRPFVASALYLGLEYYFGRVNFAAVSAYVKDLDAYIVSETRLVDFAELALPGRLLTKDREGQLFALSRPVNGRGGKIYGVELSARYELSSGLGMLANYTYSHGNSQYSINAQPVKGPLLNLSKHTAQLTLYYENAVGGVRVSTSFRDRYFTGVDNINGFLGLHSMQFFDAALYFQLTPQFKLSLDALNLSNEPIDMFANATADRPLVYTRSGRSWQLGLHAQF